MKMSIIVLSALLTLASTIASSRKEDVASSAKSDDVYVVEKVEGSVDWNSIPTTLIDKVLWGEDVGVRAQGQLCHDDENLYVHLSATEKDIRAENTAPLSPVHEDSCLEFFFSLDDGANYFNFEINPNGCLCLQFGPERSKRIDIVKRNAAEYFDIQTNRTSDGWEVFYRIPLDFIRLFYRDYRFEGDFTANMYKCGDKTAHKHYLSRTPIDLETPNFHCPEYFREMRFE